MGKDGRIKKDIDWSEWYNDDEKASDNKPSVMVMSFSDTVPSKRKIFLELSTRSLQRCSRDVR